MSIIDTNLPPHVKTVMSCLWVWGFHEPRYCEKQQHCSAGLAKVREESIDSFAEHLKRVMRKTHDVDVNIYSKGDEIVVEGI